MVSIVILDQDGHKRGNRERAMLEAVIITP
jgi:hypothetical protein